MAISTTSSSVWRAISQRLRRRRPLSYLDLPERVDLRSTEQVTQRWDDEWRRRLANNPKIRRAEAQLDLDSLPRMEELQRIDGSIDDYTA